MSMKLTNDLGRRRTRFLFCVLFFLVATTAWSQERDVGSLRKSDVLKDISKPGIITCLDRSSRKDDLKFRITNNYIWTIQIPVESGGRHSGTTKLSNGREVAVLADNTTFQPFYWIESKDGEIKRGYSGHDATNEYLMPRRSVSFSFKRKDARTLHIYFDFNYEWELDTIHLASPRHRVQIDLDEDSSQGSRCVD